MMEPKEIHKREQAEAAFVAMAGYHGAYFLELVRLGLEREEALELTKSYQVSLSLTVTKGSLDGR